MMGGWRNALFPAAYHGHNRRPPFFEGWYFKVVDATERRSFAFIPGIFLSDDPARHHAFIQVLDGQRGTSSYHTFDSAAFRAPERVFDVGIGPNHFSANRLRLDLSGPERRVVGDLYFPATAPWPVTLAAPGIMGPFAWAPAMECYHGVVSLDHGIAGSLEIDGELIDFTGGRGYIEKDWGRSFPDAWIWCQTNHFGSPGICLTGSIATIPWLGRSFPGFIVGLWHDGRLYRFATYTRARTVSLSLAGDELNWHIEDARYRLEIGARRAAGSPLQAPTTAEMGRRIAETLSATVAVRLSELRTGSTVYEGVGRHAGLEIVGDLARLGVPSPYRSRVGT